MDLTENMSFTSQPFALLSKSKVISISPLTELLSPSCHGSSSFSSKREPLHLDIAASVWKVSFVAYSKSTSLALRNTTSLGLNIKTSNTLPTETL